MGYPHNVTVRSDFWSAHTTNGWKSPRNKSLSLNSSSPQSHFTLTSSTLLCTQSGNHLDLSHFLSPRSLSHPLSLAVYFSPHFFPIPYLLHLILSRSPISGSPFCLPSTAEPGGNSSCWRSSSERDAGRTPRQQPARQRKWNILQMGWDDSTCFQSGVTCFRNITEASAARRITSLL